MNNTASSVDVVKDCFGMREIRKNKSTDLNQQIVQSTDDSLVDGEYNW